MEEWLSRDSTPCANMNAYFGGEEKQTSSKCTSENAKGML